MTLDSIIGGLAAVVILLPIRAITATADRRSCWLDAYTWISKLPRLMSWD